MKYCYECKHYHASDGDCDQTAWCKVNDKCLGWIGPKNDLKIPQDCPKNFHLWVPAGNFFENSFFKIL